MRIFASLFCLVGLNATVVGDELLLEDFQNGGVFRVSRFDNDFRDASGRKNNGVFIPSLPWDLWDCRLWAF